MKSTSEVTGKTFFIKGDLSGDSKNFMFLITCDKCKDEYICFAINFKPHFRIPKSENVKTKKVRCGTSRHFIKKKVRCGTSRHFIKKKVRCGTSRHFIKKCLCSASLFGYLKVQIIEQVYSEDPSKNEERYWQSQLFTVSHGMNNINDLYSKKRKRYRK